MDYDTDSESERGYGYDREPTIPPGHSPVGHYKTPVLEDSGLREQAREAQRAEDEARRRAAMAAQHQLNEQARIREVEAERHRNQTPELCRKGRSWNREILSGPDFPKPMQPPVP